MLRPISSYVTVQGWPTPHSCVELAAACDHENPALAFLKELLTTRRFCARMCSAGASGMRKALTCGCRCCLRKLLAFVAAASVGTCTPCMAAGMLSVWKVLCLVALLPGLARAGSEMEAATSGLRGVGANEAAVAHGRRMSELARSNVVCTDQNHLGKFHIRVLSASSLPDKDTGSDTSDPYAKVTWGGSTVDLESVQTDSENPSWPLGVFSSHCVRLLLRQRAAAAACHLRSCSHSCHGAKSKAPSQWRCSIATSLLLMTLWAPRPSHSTAWSPSTVPALGATAPSPCRASVVQLSRWRRASS